MVRWEFGEENSIVSVEIGSEGHKPGNKELRPLRFMLLCAQKRWQLIPVKPQELPTPVIPLQEVEPDNRRTNTGVGKLQPAGLIWPSFSVIGKEPCPLIYTCFRAVFVSEKQSSSNRDLLPGKV